MRRSGRRQLVALVAMLTLILGVLAATTQLAKAAPTPQAATVSTASYSGQDLMRGLFFGSGRFAQAQPQLVQVKAELSSSQERMITKIQQRIDTQDPSFFNRFKAQVSSGDPYTVLAGMAEGQAHFEQAAAALGGRTSVSPDATGKCVVVFAVAVVVVAVVKFKVKVKAASLSTEQGIARDRWMGDIASTLTA